ncbi:U11/U12 small nuclear ribonucleoprotein 48 kDa protein-like [Bombus pyrosoma]|uniref:U11/U12 small nuclear ribonucleoprotein 48 kDa protein-like n=1 Tax=Bombus pyrosoma TaxID=396416 RepID=UPI001CB931FD|nr:U11/U12 small nuclear ribonucleoprotein 48 kDa protein-like [Bombus pyrosoma]XP_043597694.1 U11/U12 small nuclear ribonucleoprotein 48 kDa protein-like [Bombus pyrosoma]
MLNSSMNDRESQCQSLDDFTKKIHQEIVETISTLNWTIESIGTDNDNMLVCPYNSSHQVSKKMLYQHLECCQLKHEGYNEFDIPLPESCLSLNSYSSIKLDSQMQNSILQKAKEKDSTLKIGLGERLIPRTSNRIFTDFTCDERKILYDYVISNTVKPDIGHDITDIQKLKSQDKEDKKLSFLELLIQERNLKRRRAKHRGVHTNKKSHIEVLREVIQQQMELYIDYITEAHATNRDTNTTTEIQSSSNSLSDTINEFPLKCNDVFIENTQNHRGHSSSQYNKKYEYFEKSYTACPKDSKQRESSRITTESRKAQKLHKHRRSHSRERDHDRKSKHGSTRTHHKKSHKSDKSFDSNTSKRSNDRREKLIL